MSAVFFRYSLLPRIYFSLAIGGCAAPEPTSPSAVDTVETDTGSPDEDTDPPIEEVCDGVDNDGDGQVDEGFDADKDGIADCLQCSVEVGEASLTEADDGYCEPVLAETTLDLSQMTELWSVDIEDLDYDDDDVNGLGLGTGCFSPIIIDVNKDHYSDIICSGGASLSDNFDGVQTRVYVFSGKDGRRLWTSEAFTDAPALTVGDINSDGDLEVIGAARSGYLIAVSTTTGEIVWESEFPGARSDPDWNINCGMSGPAEPATFAHSFVVDLDKDGDWEIVSPLGFFDASTGAALAEIERDECAHHYTQMPLFEVTFADLNGDSVDEIVILDTVLDIDGKVLWSAELDQMIQVVAGREEDVVYHHDFFSSLVVNADEDALPELVFIDHHQFKLYDDDGSLLLTRRIHSREDDALAHTGQSCVADINGDGQMDLIIPTGAYIDRDTMVTAWDLTGRRLWEQDFTIYGSGHCTTFDFNNDGKSEVIVGGNFETAILNGETGEILYSIPRAEFLHPFIGANTTTSLFADLDGDGSSEWILASYLAKHDEEPVLRVFGHPSQAWPPGGRIWPVSNWSGSGMQLDGTPQNDQPPTWISPGRYRAQADVQVVGSDLRPLLYDSCEADEEARLSIAVENIGLDTVSDTITVSVADAEGVELHSERILTTILPQHHSATVEVLLTPEQASAGVTVSVFAEDAHDCSVTNNTLAWSSGAGG